MDTLSPPMDACRLLVTREGTRGRGGRGEPWRARDREKNGFTRRNQINAALYKQNLFIMKPGNGLLGEGEPCLREEDCGTRQAGRSERGRVRSSPFLFDIKC